MRGAAAFAVTAFPTSRRYEPGSPSDRPEAQALWAPADADWRAAGEFVGGSDDEGGGRWNLSPQVPQSWPLAWEDVRFHAANTPFRHQIGGALRRERVCQYV